MHTHTSSNMGAVMTAGLEALRLVSLLIPAHI